MDKAKKKRIQKYITWGLMAALVLFLAVMPLMAKTEEETDGPQASILSGTVETGNVSLALHGGGTLEAGEPEDVTIPTEVKITEFLVKNGDVVTEGTPLANVDKVSVMMAIVEVRETMDYLMDQMESQKNETVSSTVSATAGGRIKEVYAKAGDDVQTVMLEHGALAVLSLDGLMAVKVERDMPLGMGDSVLVKFSDGTEVSGRVESNLNGEITVTVEDDGYAIGETVTITTEDGDRVGSGELYVHDAWAASAFAGTVSTVYAKEESTVYSGSTLFTLTDTEFTAQRNSLAGQYREYEELLQKLFKMHESGTIDAPCDGIIAGIDKESPHLLSAGEADWQAVPLTMEAQPQAEAAWRVILLDNSTVCVPGEGCPLDATSTAHDDSCIKACDKAGKNGTCDAAVHYSGCIKACDHGDKTEDCNATVYHYSDCIRDCDSATVVDACTASKHYAACIESCIASDGTKECPADVHKTDCIESCDKTADCPGTKHHYGTCLSHCTGDLTCEATNHTMDCALYGVTYTAQAAIVSSVGEQVIVRKDALTVYTIQGGDSGWELVSPSTLNTSLMITEDKISASNAANCAAGDIILIVSASNASGDVLFTNRVYVYQKGQGGSQTGGIPGLGSLAGLSGFAGMSGMSGMGGTTTQNFEMFDLEGSVLMTVTPQDTMTLTITLDEHDIAKVSPGQAAQVKVEALRGETFAAEVTKVSTSGTSSGGSSKFTVELTLLDKDADMLVGMSATASIPLSTKEDVLTIPVAALVENGAETVVYTDLDEETGDPSAPVTVTIGISDGETAELLSGLEQGDTYYYSYYDTLELSTDVEQEGFSFR